MADEDEVKHYLDYEVAFLALFLAPQVFATTKMSCCNLERKKEGNVWYR